MQFRQLALDPAQRGQRRGGTSIPQVMQNAVAEPAREHAPRDKPVLVAFPVLAVGELAFEPEVELCDLAFAQPGEQRVRSSPVGQAIAYAQSNWAALCRYPEHGDLSIDNNLAERMLRVKALGRKNWTFLGSDRGGRTAAVLYSFTGTCKHHDIDPFAYLQDVLSRLPSMAPGQLDELLPNVWFGAHPSARRKTAA